MMFGTNEFSCGVALGLSFGSGRNIFRLTFAVCLLMLLGSAICQPVLGAAINYGDFEGTTVFYTQVTEDANSIGDDPPMFGAPSVTSDSLDFNPVGFSAASAGGVADITGGQLSFGIMAKPAHAIQTITLGEGGDTLLAGFGTDATFTAVTAHIFLDIYEVDFVPLGIPLLGLEFDMTFSPSGGSFGLLSDGGGGPIYSDVWEGSIVMNVAQILANNNILFEKGATKVSINLDNTLVALSQANTQSLIAKKQFGGLTITVNGGPGGEIPEPSTMILVGVGLLGLFVGRRARIE
ncbi:MAG: PEP-CTERM sorting domain-containing protein [Pirellulales bacterium]